MTSYPVDIKRCLSMKAIVIILLFACFFPTGTFADWVPYSSSLPAGSRCTVEIHMLHPTQFAIGYWEVDRRAEKVMTKNPVKMDKYLKEHVGKIVVGPAGEPYIFDRHHMAFLMYRTGKSSFIYATVEANFASLPVDSFWKEMVTRKWAYLYDSSGKGPLDPRLLPGKISNLHDDPFRSLAWAVREQDGYHASEAPFAEFQWANYFRSKFVIDNANLKMEQIIQEALKLCHLPSAAGLPGYYKISGVQEKTP